MKPIYGLIANLSKANSVRVARRIAAFLRKKKSKVWVEDELFRALRMKGVQGVSKEELLKSVDLLIALGGDGTILTLARMMRERKIPILGVNLGGLGFLTEVKLKDLDRALEELVAGRYRVEKRMTLEARVRRGGKVVATYNALNDVVVTNGALARVIHLQVMIQSEYVSSYMSDGIIVATPTGSTAYSLSSGGPIVHPSTSAILMTPICPHTLTNRPILVPEDRVLRIKIRVPGEDVMLTVDGQIGLMLKVNDLVEVKKSPWPAKLVALRKVSYFDILREKLNWGGMPPLKAFKK